MPKLSLIKSFKTNLILRIIIFLFFVAFSAAVVWFSWPKLSIVYLDTGDIYFGKLAFLPVPYLKDAWFLQRDQAAGITLIPVSTTFWKPKNLMFLSLKHIVFWSEIAKDSSANQVIEAGIQDSGNANLPVESVPPTVSALPALPLSSSPSMP